MCKDVSTFSVIYPLKSRSNAPGAILDAIANLTVQLKVPLKLLKTENARNITSSSFTTSLAKLDIGFYPSLRYPPQENGEAKCLNCTLGDILRAMMTQSSMLHVQLTSKLSIPKLVSP
ncbi:hypothetical protein O181_040080 [Austropuccinia psidii MF-1]|uniref:Integrase catalytic domain-containing protein n=1 Tax=Austropuccinia psidii MF-1 TaxID=1389203 RepID=A0A9Q3HFS4_9BASI|nr:hypothetical protein [Austropuccinia psidii MF-1]